MAGVTSMYRKVIKSRVYSNRKKLSPQEGMTLQKDENNKKFAEYCKGVLNTIRFQKQGKILYLDGPEARTTTTLLNHKIPKERLMPVSHSRDAYDNFSGLVPEGNAYYGTVDSLLYNKSYYNPETQGPLAAIWLDYCCTLEGTKKDRDRDEHPLADIERLLDIDSGYVTDGTVFALTLCRRGNSQRPYMSDGKYCRYINEFICDQGYYNAIHLTYYGYFMAFGMTLMGRIPRV